MKRLLPKKKKRAPPQRVRDHPHAEFEYALQEYHQTVRPTYSNDDGLHEQHLYEQQQQQQHQKNQHQQNQHQQQQYDMENPMRTASEPAATPRSPMPPIQEVASLGVASGDGGTGTRTRTGGSCSAAAAAAATAGYQQQQHTPYTKSTDSYYYVDSGTPNQQQDYPYNDIGSNAGGGNNNNDDDATYYQPLDAPMPDTYYEEVYGDAYVGAPIKYVYPSGYQSMRPRGGPWKLSIAICVLFTWLSVFIVGHCSDYSDQNSNNNSNNNNNANYNEIDDDAMVIETKWCGSRLLYFMWVMSMLITGLSAAYCSVIGYIKMRDFAVANERSQPPGMVGKQSDYYVSVDDVSNSHQKGGGGGGGSNNGNGGGNGGGYYQKSIYQSDGTPQFWGNHIYRPTQAAVAVTSR